MSHALIFNTHSHPDILRPFELVANFSQPLRTFCEHLEYEMGVFIHHCENLLDEFDRNILVK